MQFHALFCPEAEKLYVFRFSLRLLIKVWLPFGFLYRVPVFWKENVLVQNVHDEVIRI